ncbi:MAG: phosphoribosylamine--glycine ligase, partial [Spirochaetales bacterium]
GKGVIIAENKEQAQKALHDIMIKKIFGESTVVIEEFLEGIEASIICFVDGKTIIPLETAQDYKRAADGDKGLNTGGMGSYSPSFVISDELNECIYKTILQPTLDGFCAEGLTYKGILFVGIMIKEGVPKVLEFNVRFGDPETQVILPRLKTDIVDIFDAIIDGRLSEIDIEWSQQQAVCVVLASKGYPQAYEKHVPIYFDEPIDAEVLHAGTATQNNALVTDGGRVLNVVAIDDSIETARKKVYTAIDKIRFEGKTFRSDIALKR